jgi:hypothetical protein
LAVLLAGGASAAQAQALNYPLANTQNVAGTYTDLGTNGTVIATTSTDDANSAEQLIGFSFSYNGATMDRFILNTNGFLKLGSAAGMAAPTVNLYTATAQFNSGGTLLGTAASDVNLLSPFNFDLISGTGGAEYRLATTGTAPNRVCTIQWKNVSDKAIARTTGGTLVGSQYDNFSFQAKLYETSNVIEFVYNSATPVAASTDDFKYAQVGIKGSGNAANQIIRAGKGSVQPWAEATFSEGPVTVGATGALNFRKTVTPDAGRTFRFAPLSANDAAVSAIYGFDRLIVPANQPVNIGAAIRNVGTAALTSPITVTLNITGANTVTATATVASLAVGATSVVNFPNVALPNLGNNTVTVSLTAMGDTNPFNNTRSMLMVTNATTFSLFTPGLGSGGFVFTADSDEGYFGARVNFNTPREIISVAALIGDAGVGPNSKSSVGETVYGVVINATTGAVLGRSANRVITTADIGQMLTFTLTTPVLVPAGNVIIGMAALPSSTGINFFPFATQPEDPTRPNTFFAGDITPPTAPVAINLGPNNTVKFPFEAVTATPATCPAPTGITAASSTPSSASVTFTGPANGASYQLVYGPTGFNPATGGITVNNITTSPVNITGLAASTCYQVYVRTVCSSTDQSALAGPVSVCTPCNPPTITAFPYSESFDMIGQGQTVPCGITVQDANMDGVTWQARATVPGSTTGAPPVVVGRGGTGNAMVYSYNPNGVTPANDWFYTPGIRMNAGSRYRLSFYYYRGPDARFTEGLEVRYGNAATAAAQTTTLYTNTAINNSAYLLASNASNPAVADMQPATTGVYYVGFRATSAADQNFLAVDDISIAFMTANSPALARAVSVFPNPSASGRFNLEVNNANAKQALGVEVTNLLGQRVYTGAAKDNFRNDLDLSTLASGIYTLKVKNGSEYTMQQISIVK